MGQINIEGLGIVDIAGTEPTPEEMAVITGGQSAPMPVQDPRMLTPSQVEPGFMGNAPPTLGQQVKESGVSLEGAPSAVRRLGGYAWDDESYNKGIASALSKHFNGDVETRIGSLSKRLEFRKPGDQQWVVVNPPDRVTLGDFAALEGQLLPMGGAALGGVGGAVAGSTGGPGVATTATIAGEMTGAFVGEAARLRRGRELGMVPDSVGDVQILIEAAKTAGLTGLGSAGLRIAWNIGKSVLFGRDMMQVSEREFAARWQEALNDMGKTGMKPTSGQVMAGTSLGDEMLSAEAALSRKIGTTGEAFRTRSRENMDAAEKFFDDLSPGTPPAQGPNIIGAGRQSVGTDIAPFKDAVIQANKRAVDAFMDTTSPRLAGGAIGEKLRTEAFRKAADVFEDEADKKYAEIGKQALGLVAPGRPLVEVLKNYKALLKSDLFASLAKEDQTLVEEALKKLVTIRQSKLLDASGKPLPAIEQIADVTWEQLSRGLSAIRRLQRNIGRGATPEADERMVGEINGALLATRDAMLAGKPALKQQVTDTEAWYKLQKNLFERSVVGRLLQKKDGMYQIPDEDVFDTLFKKENITAAKYVASILDRPDYAMQKEALRSAVRQRYRQQVMDIKTGTASPEDHAKFMADYGDTIRPFFSPDELAAMQKPALYTQFLKAAQVAHDNAQKALNQSFAGKLAGLDFPEDAIAKTWVERRPGPARELFGIVKNSRDPGLMASYKSAIHENMRRDISVEAGVDTAIDPTKLGKYLADYAPHIEQWFGRKYLEDLALLQRAMQRATQVGPYKDMAVEGLAETPKTDALFSLLRVYFAPFSTRGRGLTAARRIEQMYARQHFGQELLDPARLHAMLELRHTSVGSKRAQELLGGLGMLEATDTDIQQ